jgi:hypothetical protein
MKTTMARFAIAILTAIPIVAPFSQAAAGLKGCNSYNYPERKAFIVNHAPGFQITGFAFCNRDGDRYSRGEFIEELSWKNVGDTAIVAFELATVRFDPFNRKLVGSKAVFGGTNSANWKYLAPGESSTDGLLDSGPEHVYTAIAYVKAVRYADGRVWAFDESQLVQAIRSVVANFKDESVDEQPPASPIPPTTKTVQGSEFQ